MYRAGILTIALALAGWVDTAQAQSCCNACGCGNCCKVCRLVSEVKKETKYEYALECEDFCLNGPSKCCGVKQEPDCSGCCRCVKMMMPTCCGVRCRAKLVKIPVVKEKCEWKCKVCCVCRGCSNCCAEVRDATETETQMALAEAARQGILLTSAEEPITVTLPMEEVAAQPQAPVVASQPEAAPTGLFRGMFGK